MTAVVFDVGNVLIRWDPHLAFLPELGSRAAVDDFMERVGFYDWNYENDRGRPVAEALATIADPEGRALLARYPERFHLTIAEPIAGTWALVERLAARGRALHAITNFAAETWPVGLVMHPRLATTFGVTVVSGHEGLVKPDAAIYRLLCERAGIAPGACLFIDDSPPNVAGALAAGMEALLFTTPEALEQALDERGLL